MTPERRAALDLAGQLRDACVERDGSAEFALRLVAAARREGASNAVVALAVVMFVQNEAHNAPVDEDRAQEIGAGLLAQLIAVRPA